MIHKRRGKRKRKRTKSRDLSPVQFKQRKQQRGQELHGLAAAEME